LKYQLLLLSLLYLFDKPKSIKICKGLSILEHFMKQVLLKILSISTLNTLLRLIIRPIKYMLPTEQLVRLPVVGQISVEFDGMKSFIMMADGKDSLATRIYWQGPDSFEASETNVYRALLDNAETILDIGANTGLYSLIAGVNNSDTKVYSFEPMPVIAETLRRNIRANSFDHVQVFEMALTDQDGEITLHVPVQSTLPMGSSTSADFRRNTKPITVKAQTLDSFISEQQIRQVDLMKIDTESTEPAVLRGGERLIKRDRPLIIIEILNDISAKPIAQFFERKEYEVYRIEDVGICYLNEIKTRADATNFLLVPTEKLQLVPQSLIVPHEHVTET
jgi:FkbM family methyltransferase